MASKKVQKSKEVKSIPKDAPVCQNCKSHKNKPSFCGKHSKHTGRKQTCEDFGL